MKRLHRTHLKSRDGIIYIENPAINQLGWATHGFLTRQSGVSLPPYDSLNVSLNNGDHLNHVLSNRMRIAKAFGFENDRLILLKQMQLDGIYLLNNPLETEGTLLAYDAILTNLPHQILGIQTADCIPILILDEKKKVIGAVHAGRQGTALEITRKVLRRMKEEWQCSERDFLITLGPSIGPCCYEIDEKVFLKEWEPFSIRKREGKWMVDLATINIAQLKLEGITEEQIYRVDLCTCCNSDLFFSYRGEGQTGRQLSFIGII